MEWTDRDITMWNVWRESKRDGGRGINARSIFVLENKIFIAKPRKKLDHLNKIRHSYAVMIQE